MFNSPKQVKRTCCVSIRSNIKFVLAVGLIFVSSLNCLLLAQTPNPDSVIFPSAEVAFIIGPQLTMGTALNPYPWFDTTQETQGAIHGAGFPAIPPITLTGSVTVNSGSSVVLGVGTQFLSEVDPNGPEPFFNGWLQVRESDGVTYRQVQVLRVDSDTQMTLTMPYAYSSQSGAEANTGYYDGTNYNNDVYMNANYYDLSLTMYVLYYRTGNVTYLNYARKVADSWWKSPSINSGAQMNFEIGGYAPRTVSLGGLILRAIDGRPEMWDWIRSYTRYTFDIWLKARVNDSTLSLGVRDGSYCLLYATWLSQALPNSFPLQGGGTYGGGAALRAGFLTDVEDVVVNYYGRLQYPDGSWRWDDSYYVDEDGGTLVGIMQPFMVGLLTQALVDVHRASSDSTVRANIQNQLVQICRHLYQDGPYRINDEALSGYRWRTFHYFYHGGTTVNPTKYQYGDGAIATAPWEIQSARQLLATSIPAYGYTYQITGDASFKQMGDELAEAAYGDVVDGIHNEAGGSTRNYNQNYRMGGRYLAWRVGAVTPPPSPTPTPTSTPTPTPTPAPTPPPTPGGSFLHDTFTEAGIPLTSHQGEVGATWNLHPNYSENLNGSIFLSSNTPNSAYSFDRNAAIASGQSSGPDYYVESKFYYRRESGYSAPAVLARVDTTNSNWIEARVVEGTNEVQLRKNVSGTNSLVSSYALASTPTAGDSVWVKLEVVGSTAIVWVKSQGEADYTLRMANTITDASLQSSGRAGLYFGFATGNAGWVFSEINAQSSASPTPTPTPTPGPNIPPVVTLTVPNNEKAFVEGQNITLFANAMDPDGVVVKVDFYTGTTLLGTVTSNPYSYTWVNVARGNYNLTAVATDNQGAVTTSGVVVVSVNRSSGSVSRANGHAQSMINSFSASQVSGDVYAGAADALPLLVLPADIAALTSEIQPVYQDFQLEHGVFAPNAGQIDPQLKAAILFSGLPHELLIRMLLLVPVSV